MYFSSVHIKTLIYQIQSDARPHDLSLKPPVRFIQLLMISNVSNGNALIRGLPINTKLKDQVKLVYSLSFLYPMYRFNKDSLIRQSPKTEIWLMDHTSNYSSGPIKWINLIKHNSNKPLGLKSLSSSTQNTISGQPRE